MHRSRPGTGGLASLRLLVRGNSALIGAVLFLGSLLGSCGPEVAASLRVTLEPLDLRAAPDAKSPGVISRYMRVLPGPDENWRTTKATGIVIEREDGGWDYELSKGDRATLIIPGPFDSSAFNRVAVELTITRDASFVLSASVKSGRRFTSPRVSCEASDEPQVLHFDLGAATGSGDKIRSLALTARGKTGLFQVHSVDLLFQPPTLYLPNSESGPGQISVNGVYRTGIAVASQRAIVASCEVQSGARLRFSYAQPRDYKRDLDGFLELTLSGSAGTEQTHTYSLDDGGREAWKLVNIPLDEFEGQDLELRWSLPDDLRSTAVIAEPGILSGVGEPRRVVLITSDTHRSDHLGSAGQGVEVRTPNLDAMSAAGVLFEDCFTSANVTNPSHIALMTATHPRDTGVLNNHEPINAAALTLAEVFHDAGFATYASISSRHLGDVTSGLGQGFDRMVQPVGEATGEARDAIRPIVKWLEESPDVPTFIWLHLFDAHTPYRAPTEITKSYYPDRSAAFDESLPDLEGTARTAQLRYPGLRDLNLPRALYRAEVTYLDQELERVLSHPLLINAVIAFTADHGESLGHHEIYYAHADLYPDSIHVPLIIRFPGAPAGTRFDTAVRQIDVGRTLLDLAGLLDATFPGRNVLAVAEQGGDQTRYALSAHAHAASVTEGPWHLILRLASFTPNENSSQTTALDLHQVELYNLETDPGALVNLADRELARTRDMRARLVDWIHAASDRGWRGGLVTDTETLRQLEALGYTAGTEAESVPHDLFPRDCSCEICAEHSN